MKETAPLQAGRFHGKVVVVTGGGSGIGRASVERFHAEGAAVMAADLNEEAGERLLSQLGGDRLLFRRTDVADAADVAAMIRATGNRFGSVDILLNNAGVGSYARTPDLDADQWRRTFAVNLDAVFHASRAVLPSMIAAKCGVILTVASISGLAADYGFAAYNSAKAGVINFMRALAIDHAAEGIRANTICPGPVDTPIMSDIETMPGMRAYWERRVPARRFAQAEEIASVIAFLASDDASFVTGVALPVDGGLTAHTGQPDLPTLLATGEPVPFV